MSDLSFQVKKTKETSLVVQRLRLHAPNAGGRGSIPVQRTRSHMPQLRAGMPQEQSCMPQQRPKIPSAAIKTWHSQINKCFLKIKYNTNELTHKTEIASQTGSKFRITKRGRGQGGYTRSLRLADTHCYT